MWITREEGWYEVNNICEKTGGRLLDAAGQPDLLSYAARLLEQSNAVWHWINGQSVSVDTQGNTWMFDDGECVIQLIIFSDQFISNNVGFTHSLH